MISALYRYPKSMRRKVARVWGLRGAASRAEMRMARNVDAETMAWRATQDARGQVIREGCTYSATGEQRWRVVRSVRGRTDQRDVIVNGQILKTCGPRRIPAWLR